jgi:plastocyanin
VGFSMTTGWYRPLMAVAALWMALLGAFSMLFLGGSRPVSAAYGHYTIEISDTGVNPATCNISRGDEVVWKNIGSQVHRIIKPDAGVNSPPLFDSGDIAPGETSSPARFDAGSKWPYYDQYNQNIKGMIITPGTAESQAANCSPLPPTPTPTPTRAPATPTPAPIMPAGCRWVGCAVAVAISSE